jgi:predicted metal-binding membrane protein
MTAMTAAAVRRVTGLVVFHHRDAERAAELVDRAIDAFQAGILHGAYCLGYCWALIAVLLAAGAMSLVWMGAIAAIVALEKASRRGEAIGSALGGVLIAAGLFLIAVPSVLATSS